MQQTRFGQTQSCGRPAGPAVGRRRLVGRHCRMGDGVEQRVRSGKAPAGPLRASKGPMHLAEVPSKVVMTHARQPALAQVRTPPLARATKIGQSI